MALLLSSDAHRELARQAAAARPRECCGLLLGCAATDERRVETVLPARNLALAPERAFLLAPEPLVGALRAERHGGPRVLGVYHSHPRGPAAPSPTDLAEMWPLWSYVILAPGGAGAMEARSFRREASGSPVCEEPVRVVGEEP